MPFQFTFITITLPPRFRLERKRKKPEKTCCGKAAIPMLLQGRNSKDW